MPPTRQGLSSTSTRRKNVPRRVARDERCYLDRNAASLAARRTKKGRPSGGEVGAHRHRTTCRTQFHVFIHPFANRVSLRKEFDRSRPFVVHAGRVACKLLPHAVGRRRERLAR